MKSFSLFMLLYCVQISAGFSQVSEQADSLANRAANKGYVQIYKENADFSFTSPKGEIGAPAKYIINGRLTATYMLLGSPALPVAFAVIPDFTVRVRDERSSGVRTPSLRLGGIFYVRLDPSITAYKYASLRFTHHSNGQDQEAINPDGTINTKTGNFTTNYLTVAYNFGSQSLLLPNQSYYTLNHEFGFEWHKWFSYEKALKHDYGFSRLIYNFSWRRYVKEKEQWRLNAGMNYAVNKMSAYDLSALKKRLNTEASFHYSFPFMNNVFLMTAIGYYGEDPYNIYYRDKYAYLRFGISSGLSRNRKN